MDTYGHLRLPQPHRSRGIDGVACGHGVGGSQRPAHCRSRSNRRSPLTGARKKAGIHLDAGPIAVLNCVVAGAGFEPATFGL